MWLQVALSLLIIVLLYYLASALRFIKSHFSIEKIRLFEFTGFRFSSQGHQTRSLKFPNALNSTEYNLLTDFPGLFVEISRASIRFSKFRVFLSFDVINMHLKSSWLQRLFSKPREKSSESLSNNSRTSKVFGILMVYINKLISITCNAVNISFSLHSHEDVDAFVTENITISQFTFSPASNIYFSFSNAKIDQITTISDEHELLNVLNLGRLECHADRVNSRVFFEFSESIQSSIDVRFLYFWTSFAKEVLCFELSQEPTSSEPFGHGFSFDLARTIHCNAQHVSLKLLLPSTDQKGRFFKSLDFSLEKPDLVIFLPAKGLPKVSIWSDQFVLSSSIEVSDSGNDHYCSYDRLMRRKIGSIVKEKEKLISADELLFTNWIEDASSRTTISQKVVAKWLEDILKGKPPWSIASEDFEFSSIINDSFVIEELIGKLADRQKAFPMLTANYFASIPDVSKVFVVHATKLDVFVPYEYPISSLLDHSVVLFKAGFRPLSSKTERGYWEGDGDKFFRSDWSLLVLCEKTRLKIEDDPFDTRLSVISHNLRKIAESRNRLESNILTEFKNSICATKPSAQTRSLVESLAINPSSMDLGHIEPISEMYKLLFAQYRQKLRGSFTPNCHLLNLSLDNFKCCLSWSPSNFPQNLGGLDCLLNRMEGGDAIDMDILSSFSTFIGGFFDVHATSVHLSLRNYSFPVFMAPDLHVLGPAFLVEAGVKDPGVLVKYSVSILPEGRISNFSELPGDGNVEVLRSILPLKLYHCVSAVIRDSQLCQFVFSPYWKGCLGLLDRVVDRFVKASTEDPSPPLPGWDKMRYHLRGCHSRLSISSPCIVRLIANADPFESSEEISLVFERSVHLGLEVDGSVVLACPDAELKLSSQHFYHLYSALKATGPLFEWDHQNNSNLLAVQSIPVIKLSKTRLKLEFDVRNQNNSVPEHHMKISPIVRTNIPYDFDAKTFDSFKSFRSQSIGFSITGTVGSPNQEGPQIRFLYYRELERWISRFLLTHHSDIDSVKRGPLFRCPAVPEQQSKITFSTVFKEIHLSVEFFDQFISRLLNFSGPNESQAVWSASKHSILKMDWRKGILDSRGHIDWVYYYGELEFLDVQFCVSPSQIRDGMETLQAKSFPVLIHGLQFYDLIRTPRLFYLTLDEKCFLYDFESRAIQCRTVMSRRQAVEDILNSALKSLNETDSETDPELYNHLSMTVSALQSRHNYYDSFLGKISRLQGFAGSRIMHHINPKVLSEFIDTSHYEIHNAQLVWNICNREIVFKLVDEIFFAQNKRFSQGREGLALMRKMVRNTRRKSPYLFSPSESLIETDDESIHNAKSPETFHSPTSLRFSSVEDIEDFFDTLLKRNSSLPTSPTESLPSPLSPFVAGPEPKTSDDQDNPLAGIDLRSPGGFFEDEAITVPRIVDLNFFNPHICFMSPNTTPSAAFIVAAHRAKLEFSPIWDAKKLNFIEFELAIDQQQSGLTQNSLEITADPKIGTRSKISLKQASFFFASNSFAAGFPSWPDGLLVACYAQDSESFSRILTAVSEETEVSLVYDVSNPGYMYTPDSPQIAAFGRGDTIYFLGDGLALHTTSPQFQGILDVIVNLLVYRDPNQELRSEKLEELLIAANLSDRRTFALKMQEYRLALDQLRHQLSNREILELPDPKQTILHYDVIERDLAILGEAMRIVQASSEQFNQKRTRLTLDVSIGRIQWTLMRPIPESPGRSAVLAFCQVALESIYNRWVSKGDGSMENTFEIGSATCFNQLPHPFYRTVLRPFDFRNESLLKATVDYGCMVRFFAKSRLPINGIVVLDHVELDLSPLQLQLTLEIALQIYKFFLPEAKSSDNSSSSDLSISRSKTLHRERSLARQSSSFFRRATVNDPLALDDLNFSGGTAFDEIQAMKDRSRLNVLFVYVKVPPSQHLLSYKGSSVGNSDSTSWLDIDRFILNLSEFEYQNRLWSWAEFFNQLRRDAIVTLIKRAGSLFADKLKKLGKKNVPEDELYIRNLARKERILQLEPDEADEADNNDHEERERERKNFLLFGKSLLKLMRK